MKRKTVIRQDKPISEAPLKKGAVITLAVAYLDEDGFGVGEHEGMQVKAPGVFPGEKASVRIENVGRRVSYVKPVKILEASPDRLKRPACKVCAECEGCPLMALNYPAQLHQKRQLVINEIRKFPPLSRVPIHEPLPSPAPLGYRNSAKLVVSGTFSSPVIGIYARHTHNVVDIGDCPLHHPLINRIVKAIKLGITKGKVPVYHPRTENGLLRYVVIRVSEAEGTAMVIFVTAWRSYNEIHHLGRYVMEQVPEVRVVAQNVNPSAGNVIMGQEDKFLTKQKTITERLGDVAFAISPRSFFQINSGGANLLYAKVREWAALTGQETVVDLYCGVGGISLFLADCAKAVHGFELIEAAVRDAEQNAKINRIKNCRFEAGDAGELLEELREEGEKVDLVVLNPPRKGCEEGVLRDVAALGPMKIIYVSCSPQSLARDLAILDKLGYQTREIQPVDMFPNTAHIENVALITAGNRQ